MRLLTTLLFAATALCGQAQTALWQDTSKSPEERAADLAAKLTIQEKAKLMMNSSQAIDRLGIPAFQWWSEALHGVGRNGYATVFPCTTGMAASWNDALLFDVFTAVSDEARAKYNAKRGSKMYQGLSFWTPNINIFRDPRWGRGQETYGEDPLLTTRMGMAAVRGLQGPDTCRYRKLLACAKHFAVHSGPEWNRHSFNVVDLPQRDLWETYLPAFKALVQKANVEEVMCAYQRIDGEPCCGSSKYERQILRDEWGFKGIVVSDCGAINNFWQKGKHEVAVDDVQAAAQAVRGGTDVECGSNYKRLPKSVASGQLTEKEMDESVRKLLTLRFKLGDFDPQELNPWNKIGPEVVCSAEHRQLALDMARQSIVLLQNRDNALPMAATEEIVVMGPNANDSVMQWGNYNGFPNATTTIWQAIRAKCPAARLMDGCSHVGREVSRSLYGNISADGHKGLKATYYNNEEFAGEPAATEYLAQPVRKSNGGNTVFAVGVNLEHFSMLIEGDFKADTDTDANIDLGFGDRARIMLDGDTIYDQWKTRNSLRQSTLNVRFGAGKPNHLRIEYAQGEGMAAAQFDITTKHTPTDAELLAEVGAAKTVVFCGGISPRLEGEEMKVDAPGFRGGDRDNIELPQAQREVVALMAKAGKRVVFINCSGGAMGLAPEAKVCDAIVQAWYGGQSGGQAVADVLFGDYNPSGCLPVTFYRSSDDLPDFLDYRMQGRTYRYFRGQPLWPFGHGLSYTTFAASKAKWNAKRGCLTLRLANTGKRDGDHTVQVYMRRTADTDGPIKTLCAFQRVSLRAGEAKTIAIDIPRERFECWDSQTNTMRVVPGEYRIMVEGQELTIKN